MSTLRERLAAKKRRSIVVPIQLEHADEREQELLVQWAEAVAREAKGEVELADSPADALLEQINEARDGRHVDVRFTAMDGEVWEKVVAEHPSPEGEDAGMDWLAALPVVAAVCCDDESMQDDDPWAELLAVMSHGERLTLWNALLHLNTDAPAAHVPKD